MSKTIFLEIRDRMTFIPVMAVSLETNVSAGFEPRDYLLKRAGYGGNYLNVHIINLNEKIGYSDAFEWDRNSGKTMFEAHRYIRDNFDTLKDGDVIDVEFILGEKDTKKKSERFDYGI